MRPPSYLYPQHVLIAFYELWRLRYARKESLTRPGIALIAMARKVIIEEPNTVPGVTLFGIAALILALGTAFYFERQAKRQSSHVATGGGEFH